MLETPFFISFAQQTLRDLKSVYEKEPSFGPILVIHTIPIEFRCSTAPVLRLASLGDFEQREWPAVIRRLVEEAGATQWGLATEVSMRFRESGAPDSVRRTEEWLVYLLCHQGGMLAWGAPIRPGRRLGPIRELTDDPRMQKMLAHLSEVTPGPGN